MLKLTNIVKEYVTGDSTVSALKGVSLEFRKSEFVSILGHSGCGKTTTLRVIAGFVSPNEGDALFDGQIVNDLPPHKRQVNKELFEAAPTADFVAEEYK